MRNFLNLVIWQKSHLLTLSIYRYTALFPKSEMFGLISQMRRSSSSISCNIAEGCGRHTIPDLIRFLTIAAGSCSELHYQLILVRDLGYIDSMTFIQLTQSLIELRKMIFKFIANTQPTTADR
jgi:four helix bundle protein